MTAPTVERIETDPEWDAAVPILQQLWTDEDEAFVRSFRDEEDYRLFGCYVDGTLVGVAGVSIQRILHHTRHAWIHDLVVDEAHRSAGYGEELLSFVEEWAGENDCEYVALALRAGNDEAAAFYDANGLDQWGQVRETGL